MQVATQFFTLQVVTVFFASFITGSLLNQLALLVTNPQQVLTILGTGEARQQFAQVACLCSSSSAASVSHCCYQYDRQQISVLQSKHG